MWAYSSRDVRKLYSSSCSQTVSLYLQPFCRSSFLERALEPKTAKINKTPYFGISGSSKVINLDTTKKLITSMPMVISNHFHETLDNNSKITTFTGVPLFDALVRSFLEPRKSRLVPSKSTFNAENFMRSSSMSIAADFGAICSWNVSHGPRLPKYP